MNVDPMHAGASSPWAEPLAARLGAVAVHATAAELVATRRSRSERAMRALLTFAGTLLAMPLAFLIPPHVEPPVVVLIAGLYFTRRAWVGEWVVDRMRGSCPRCGVENCLKAGTVLYLPHTLHCRTCRSELWLELAAAPVVAEDVRARARDAAAEPPRDRPGGRPPLTWSPSASNWRDP